MTLTKPLRGTHVLPNRAHALFFSLEKKNWHAYYYWPAETVTGLAPRGQTGRDVHGRGQESEPRSPSPPTRETPCRPGPARSLTRRGELPCPRRRRAAALRGSGMRRGSRGEAVTGGRGRELASLARTVTLPAGGASRSVIAHSDRPGGNRPGISFGRRRRDGPPLDGIAGYGV